MHGPRHMHKEKDGKTVKPAASSLPPSSELPGGQKPLPKLDQTHGREQDEPCNALLI